MGRAAARDLLEVGEFDLQRDGPSPDAFAFTVSPDLGDQRPDFGD